VPLSSTSARAGAFGLPCKPLTKHSLVRALKKTHTLFKRNPGKAKVLVAHSLFLDVVFSCKLIHVPVGTHVKWLKSALRKSRWEIAPVWKTAPSTAWRRANRLCVLFGDIAKFGFEANIAHDLMRLSIFCWKFTTKEFDGLCRRIYMKCRNVASLAGKQMYMPETALRLKTLNATPSPHGLENMARCHMKGYNTLKYGCKNRPSSLDGAAMLLNVKRRSR